MNARQHGLMSSRAALIVTAALPAVSALAYATFRNPLPALHGSGNPGRPHEHLPRRHALPAPARAERSLIASQYPFSARYRLTAGEPVSITVHILRPSLLPPNGRLAVTWSADASPTSAAGQSGWRKVLHALDSDVTVAYRAPAAGTYTLRIEPVTAPQSATGSPRWREKGSVTLLVPVPDHAPWAPSTPIETLVRVEPSTGDSAASEASARTIIARKPNSTPALAQSIDLSASAAVETWEITGSSDDVDYFDNPQVGQSGEEWFRLNYRGRETRMLTAQLSMPAQTVAARVRCYEASATPAAADRLKEYRSGQDANERSHQQDEEHRSSICRTLEPGKSYLLRVESNSPGYQLQLRVLPPAPYTDPRMAVRQGMYTLIGQVDAWLTNRPRGISIERRVRDSGNLLGSGCMSCHTQSGAWGPAGAVAAGYRPENIQNLWHLKDVMYECLRPTNVLKDAVNNTSLAPLDVGDGPAGTRAAGFNIVNTELVIPPAALRAPQQVRTANYVLQTGDPGGINAAGPGSNVGQMIVYLFSGRILQTAWLKTGGATYVEALFERAERTLKLQPQYTDDVALRIEFFKSVLPADRMAAWAADARGKTNAPIFGEARVKRLAAEAAAQCASDAERIRAIQNSDGSWGFSPGAARDGGRSWVRGDGAPDPSPTALCLLALSGRGAGPSDPAIASGVRALLAMQEPSGRWNRAAQTGFVTTAYALHALARIYPEAHEAPAEATLPAGLPGRLHRTAGLALRTTGGERDLEIAALDAEPAVRWWAQIGIGARHSDSGLRTVMLGLTDDTHMVREAGAWALRQMLLDNRGWPEALSALDSGDDTMRLGVIQALTMRVQGDGTLPVSTLTRLASLLDRAMNDDPSPAVRAYAAKAAWQWWVWNRSMRPALNAAWVRMLLRPEPNAIAENAARYATQALFIVNGHRGNGSSQHQYPELPPLFTALTHVLDTDSRREVRERLALRLVGVAATFYGLSGGDGGPGQMGYATAGAAEMMGKAGVVAMALANGAGSLTPARIALEGSDGIPYAPLTSALVAYSTSGPEPLRRLAASGISDPRSVVLAAVPELVGPQREQVDRGAAEPARRAQLSDPIIDLWARVNWNIPKTDEQRKGFFDLIIPHLTASQDAVEIAKIMDPARRAAATRQADIDHYLADRLGEALQRNPDLHVDFAARAYFPKSFHNPNERRFWLRNVEWILALPTPPGDAGRAQEAVRDGALQLYLDSLQPGGDAELQAIAVRMSGQTALRTNPEVGRALERLLPLETVPEQREIIRNVLKQSRSQFLPQLVAALKMEGAAEPTQAQIDDVVAFRDLVLPELTRQKRADQQSCMGCHGTPGRVPSMGLKAPDAFGYLPLADLLSDYRTLQKRVNLKDLERSKLLRKPLNIQDGKEDGHQGGRRYAPDDPGYLVIRRWVENQPRLAAGAPAGP